MAHDTQQLDDGSPAPEGGGFWDSIKSGFRNAFVDERTGQFSFGKAAGVGVAGMLLMWAWNMLNSDSWFDKLIGLAGIVLFGVAALFMATGGAAFGYANNLVSGRGGSRNGGTNYPAVYDGAAPTYEQQGREGYIPPVLDDGRIGDLPPPPQYNNYQQQSPGALSPRSPR